MKLLIPLVWAIVQVSVQAPTLSKKPQPAAPLDRSSYFAFVDKEFLFTIEFVKPGVPLFNFVSLVDKENNLLAKQVRMTFDNRKVPGTFFVVDTGDPKEPIIVPSVRMKPKSSFGVRLQGDFGNSMEAWGVSITVGEEDFRLVPLTSFEFENLALKINRLNMSSPDLSDDWRVLKLENLGSRVWIGRRRTQ
jgi:hypothetical protein